MSRRILIAGTLRPSGARATVERKGRALTISAPTDGRPNRRGSVLNLIFDIAQERTDPPEAP